MIHNQELREISQIRSFPSSTWALGSALSFPSSTQALSFPSSTWPSVPETQTLKTSDLENQRGLHSEEKQGCRKQRLCSKRGCVQTHSFPDPGQKQQIEKHLNHVKEIYLQARGSGMIYPKWNMKGKKLSTKNSIQQGYHLELKERQESSKQAIAKGIYY